MAKQLYTNNSVSTLASSATSGATTITLTTGGGALFASPSGGDWQMLTLTSGAVVEVVKMTGAAGDVLTIVRAQEGTSAAAWVAGDIVSARLTAGMLDRLVENSHPGIGVALRTDQATQGAESVSIGPYTEASGNFSAALGGRSRAYKELSVALAGGVAERDAQFVVAAHSCIPRDDWWAGYGSEHNAFSESGFASHFVDLGSPPAWSSGLTVMDGAVVRPTTPNGFQYFVYAGNYVHGASNSRTEAAGSEPTWPTTIGDSWGTGSGASQIDYVATNLATGMDEIIPAGMVFYPTEVGFICFTYSGVTAAPFVSIGTAASPTLLVGNQQLTSITGANQRHAFTGFKDGITDLRIKLDTAATGAGARFHGRFYAKGTFIQTQG